jgi:hypothetical protein
MANQIIIDIGAVANDGTGDPLRTAFDYVNDNFSNIWATGVANSNIAFSGNRILTVNTNGNLVLAPNGTGKVQSNVDIIPNATNTLNLGSLTRKWNTVYTQNLTVDGNVTVGDLTVDGNLTVTGNTIQIGNIVTDTKTIQLANTAVTANAANGSGVTVGAADNIATILYSSTGNVWTTNIGISAVGNITAPYFFGNGSQLTGIEKSRIANGASQVTIPQANGAVFVDQGTQGVVRFAFQDTGNVFTNIGEIASQQASLLLISDLNSSESTLKLNSDTGTLPGANLSTRTGTIEISTNTLYGSKTWEFGGLGDLTAPGNIMPEGNNTQSLGNATNRWANLWLSGNTIQLGNLSLSASANGLTSTSGFNLANSTAANIEATGNITANNFVATEWIYGNIGVETHQIQFTDTLSGNGINLLNNGGFLVYESNLGSAGGFVPSADDSESIGQSDRRWATVYANAFIGNTQGLVGNITNLDSLNFSVENISALVGNNGVNIGAGGYNNLVVLPTEVLIQNVPLTVAGNILSTVAGGLNITANTVANGVAQIWNFGTDGDLTVPGNIVAGNARISLQEPSFDSVYITPVTDDTTSITLDPSGIVLNCAVGMTVSANTAGNVIAWSFNDEGAFGLPYGGTLDNDSTGDVELRSTNNMSFEANAVVNIYTDTNGTTYQWQFDTTGNLNLPNGGSIIVDGGDGVVGPDGDNMVISWDNEELILRSVGGDVDVEADRDFNIRVNYDVGATDYLTKWVFGQNNEIVNITGNSAIITEAGNLNLQGGRNTLSSGNVQITAVNNGVAVNTWTFDNTGNLNLPAGGHLVGTTANNSGFIAWAGNSSGDGNGYTTIRLVPDDTREGSDQYLIIDPTAPGHIHIRAGGTQDNSSADLFLGGENSYFKVASGANAEVQVTSNNNTWVFNTDGNLQVPGNINGDNNAPLVIDGASSGEGYISLPSASFGGEQIAIVNKFSLGNGIRLETNGGNLFFDNNGDLTVPGNISGNTAGYAIGYRDIPQVSFTGNATIATTDAGKHFYSTQSTNYTLTIANNASQSFQVGAAITIVNQGTGTITIAQGSGVTLYLAGNATSGNRSVSTFGMATVMKVATDTWFINGTGVS